MIAPALALLLTLSFNQDTKERVKSDVKAAVKEVGEVGKKIGRTAKEGGKEVGKAAKATGKGIAKGSKEAAKEIKDTVTK